MTRLVLALAIYASLSVAAVAQVGGLMFPGPGGAAAAGGGLDSATTAWLTAVTGAGGSVSPTRQTVVDTFIVCMKGKTWSGGGSLWANLDRYWLLASENNDAAHNIDMTSHHGTLSLTGTPSFTANKGFTPSTGNTILTDFTPSTSGVNYTQNSASYGGFINTNVNIANPNWGASDGGFTIVSYFESNNGGSAFGGVNGTNVGNMGVAISTGRGEWVLSRTGATATAMYQNGSSITTGSTASTGLPPNPYPIDGTNPAFTSVSGAQFSSTFFAGGWNATDASNFNSCESAMLTSIGVLP